MNIVIDNEFKNLIPPLTPEEFAGLKQSLMSEGCRDPLVLWGDILIDGHNRYDICTRKNIPFTTVQKEFASREDAILWMIDNQESRRNLTAYARGVLEEKRIAILQKQAKANQAAAGGDKKSEECKKIAFCEITKSDSVSGQRESSCDYKPVSDGAHAFDFLAIQNKRLAIAAEVKTKALMNKYKATGFNLSTWKDYIEFSVKHRMQIFVFFVDEHRKQVYGNWLSKLEQQCEIDGITYPFNLACRNGRIIRLYPYAKMKHIADISDSEAAQLKQLSTRNYDYKGG